VLLRVHAAGLDPGVWHLVTGLPYPVRLAGYGLRRPKNLVPGRDVAGRVEAVGPGVTRFKAGDEVFGTCEGSLAEYARAHQDRLAAKPPGLSFEAAAAVPTSAFAALQALRDRAGVRPGQDVLIIGAGGGVGTYAVQLATAMGARVTAVCGPDKGDLARSLGAGHVIDYTREDFTRGPRRYDVIVDAAGNRPLSHLRRVLTPRGTLVIVGGEGAKGRWLQGTQRQLAVLLLAPFARRRLRNLLSADRQEDLVHLTALLRSGKITPVVGRTYPLSELPEAIRHLSGGHAHGKTVITPG
jgi:NADPH:quinone reductase-like Zn-dependent oxidoreductase